LPSNPQDLSPEQYTYTLSPEEVAEIITGTDTLLARGFNNEEAIKQVRPVTSGWDKPWQGVGYQAAAPSVPYA
jgi:hypothetical protein